MPVINSALSATLRAPLQVPLWASVQFSLGKPGGRQKRKAVSRESGNGANESRGYCRSSRSCGIVECESGDPAFRAPCGVRGRCDRTKSAVIVPALPAGAPLEGTVRGVLPNSRSAPVPGRRPHPTESWFFEPTNLGVSPCRPGPLTRRRPTWDSGIVERLTIILPLPKGD